MNKWQIKDLQGVGDVELSLDDSKRVFVLFGTNGVGKTQTLESLLIYFLLKTQSFEFYQSLLDASRLPENALTKHFSFIKINNEIYELQYGSNRFSHIDYDSFYENKNGYIFEALAYLGAKSRDSLARFDDIDYHPRFFGSFEQRQSTLFEEISIALSNNQLKSLGMQRNIHQWFVERAQSVNPYQRSDDNRKVDIDTVLEALHKIDSRIEKVLNVDGDGNVFLTIEGQERELSELSSGFISVVKIIQSIISFYSDFTNSTDLLNVKGVVLIDEIESHLHLEWQVKIIPTLKKLFPNTTFYIATHSPLVLSQLEEGEAYLLKRDEDGVVRSQIINSPNTRLLENVLPEAFDIDLNELKRQNMENIDQTKVQQKLLKLLNG